jgi:hypothetical protein
MYVRLREQSTAVHILKSTLYSLFRNTLGTH